MCVMCVHQDVCWRTELTMSMGILEMPLPPGSAWAAVGPTCSSSDSAMKTVSSNVCFAKRVRASERQERVRPKPSSPSLFAPPAPLSSLVALLIRDIRLRVVPARLGARLE